MLLTAVVFLPLVAAGVLALPVVSDRLARIAWVAVTALDLAGVLVMWAGYTRGGGLVDGIGYETDLEWIPSLGSGYHVGVDGLSLPLLALSAGLFLACAIWSLHQTDRPGLNAALFLALQTTCLGLFASLDLLLFFVFFDLSIVGMYAVIAGWGHGPTARRSALQFFLYTFLGSLLLLLGFLGLYLGAAPHTFDMVALAQDPPLLGRPLAGGLTLLALFLGLAIKTPVVPFHTWLPPAHTDAPATGSAVLAGVLLKMGAYGFVRIAMPMLPDQWRRYAVTIIVVGVVSALWGALAALAQTDLKRMIAYTSVNHMGYVLLALGAAGLAGDDAARSLAVNGAVTQMVSHGLITGALFLLAGVLWQRRQTYAFADWGGLASPAPRLTGLFAVGMLASLGLPALSGFVAELQIFAGSLSTAPVGTAVALTGIVLTAGLLLRAFHAVFLGDTAPAVTGTADVQARELAAIAPLLALSLLIGVYPAVLLDVIAPAADAVVSLVSR